MLAFLAPQTICPAAGANNIQLRTKGSRIEAIKTCRVKEVRGIRDNPRPPTDTHTHLRTHIHLQTQTHTYTPRGRSMGGFMIGDAQQAIRGRKPFKRCVCFLFFIICTLGAPHLKMAI